MLYADLLFSAAVLFFLLLLFFWHSKKVTLLREVGTDFIIFLQVKEFLWINELLEHTQEREHFEKWGFFLCCRSEPSFLFIKREDRLRTPHSSDVSHAELCVSRQWCVTSLSLFFNCSNDGILVAECLLFGLLCFVWTRPRKYLNNCSLMPKRIMSFPTVQSLFGYLWHDKSAAV